MGWGLNWLQLSCLPDIGQHTGCLWPVSFGYFFSLKEEKFGEECVAGAGEEDDSGSEDENFCWEQQMENRVEIFLLIIFNMPGLYSSEDWHFYHNVVVK